MTQGPHTPGTPPTPQELWEELIQEAGEDEIEAACAESDEEVEAYLAANGFDVEAERAEGEAFLAALAGDAADGDGPVAAPESRDPVQASDAPESERDVAWEAPRRRPVPVERSYPAAGWIATAATVALGAAAVTSVVAATPGHPERGEDQTYTPPPKVSPAVGEAMELRERAKIALDGWSSEECLRLLDAAKARDPKGDEADDVVAMRKTAEERMQVGPKTK